jgi:phosphoglycerate dehydrogenase-like enzyme
MMATRWIFRSFCAVAALLAATGAHAAQSADVATTLARHGVQEHTTAQREAPQWAAPRKVLLLQYGLFRGGDISGFPAAAPGARIVAVTDTASAIREAADADVIIGHNPDICDRRIIDAARQLRWLASLSAGIELCANLPTLKNRPVTMTNMRGIDSPVIAEHAIALMLALAHGLDRFAADTSRGVWSRSGGAVQLQYLDGKTMLVAGLGGIGTEVARRAHALGMKVIATRVGGSVKPDFVEYVGQPDELLTLARRADVVVSCLPLTPETTGLYDQQFFSVLKPTAYFINVARGGSVVTSALLAALTEGRLAGAGLDVVDPEPLPPGHPLWSAPRVLLTPHISGRSDLPGDARWVVATENLRRYAAGDRLLNVVDLQRGF